MKDKKPSSTAKLVSNGLWYLSNSTYAGIVPDLMTAYVKDMTITANNGLFNPSNRIGLRLLKAKMHIMQKLAIPNFYLHFLRRKLCIEELTIKAIANGAKQVVVVGAGYDTLALRIATNYPKLRVFELDHQATQQVKKRAISTVKHPFDNLELIAGDLSKESLLTQIQKSDIFDSSKHTVFVSEGLLMYLTETEVCETFKGIAQCAKNVSFVFSFMKINSLGDFQFEGMSKAARAWLKYKNELFKWGIALDQLPNFIESNQYKLLDLKTKEDLMQYLPKNMRHLPMANGENIALVQSQTNY